MERRIERRAEPVERGGKDLQRLQALLSAFKAPKEKKLVLDKRAAETGAELFAIERGRQGAQFCRNVVAPPVEEAFTVNVVGARASDHVNGASRGQLGGEIETGLANLEFTNGNLRNVLRGGADGFVADVHAVHLNASGAAEVARERDGRETVFCGIEVGAILNLYAGLELREVEEVAAIDRQRFDLLTGEHTLNGGLFFVDGNGGRFDRHDGFSEPTSSDSCRRR